MHQMAKTISRPLAWNHRESFPPPEFKRVKNYTVWGAGGVGQWLEGVLIVHEAPASIPSTANGKKKMM